jgi:hypothetical protein
MSGMLLGISMATNIFGLVHARRCRVNAPREL